MPRTEAQRAMQRANHLIDSLPYHRVLEWPAFSIHARYMRLTYAISKSSDLTKHIHALNKACDNLSAK